MYLLWIIVAIAIFLVAVISAGYDDVQEPVHYIGIAAFLAIVWPVILAVLLIVAPIALLYYSGKWLRKLVKQ